MAAQNKKLHTYRLSLGDSTDDTVGCVAVVRAPSRRQALEIALDEIPETATIHSGAYADDGSGVVYINVYINADTIRIDDVELANNDFPELNDVADACSERGTCALCDKEGWTGDGGDLRSSGIGDVHESCVAELRRAGEGDCIL